MLSGAIPFSNSFSLIEIMHVIKQCLINHFQCSMQINTDTYTLFNMILAYQFAISHMTIESTFKTDSVGASYPVYHSVAM